MKLISRKNIISIYLYSIGDLPIELPHLEDEDEMYKLGLLEESRISYSNLKNRGRSRSLDEDECVFTKTVFQRGRINNKSSHLQRKQILRETRKAFTLDDELINNNTNGIPGPELSNSLLLRHKKDDSQDIIDDDLEDLEDDLDGKLLKNLKTTIRYLCTLDTYTFS